MMPSTGNREIEPRSLSLSLPLPPPIPRAFCGRLVAFPQGRGPWRPPARVMSTEKDLLWFVRADGLGRGREPPALEQPEGLCGPRCPERLQSFGCGAAAMRSWPGQGRQLAEVAQAASVLAGGRGTLQAPGGADGCPVAGVRAEQVGSGRPLLTQFPNSRQSE